FERVRAGSPGCPGCASLETEPRRGYNQACPCPDRSCRCTEIVAPQFRSRPPRRLFWRRGTRLRWAQEDPTELARIAEPAPAGSCGSTHASKQSQMPGRPETSSGTELSSLAASE